MMRQLRKVVGAAVLGTVVSGAAVAADPSCATVRMADPGWSTSPRPTRSPACCWRAGSRAGGAADRRADRLPLLQNNDIDVFLGNWMPAQTAMIEPLPGREIGGPP